MRIRLTKSAASDLEFIHRFIEADNPTAATATVLRVLSAIEGIVEFPNIGRPGRVHGSRELVVSQTPFIAVYRLRANTIWVLRVLHGSQKW